MRSLQDQSQGGENPLTIHKIYAALTPSDSRSDWASESAAAKHQKLKCEFLFFQYQSFDKGRGDFLLEKVSVFIRIRVLFWPLGVFFNFDNKRMYPPKYRSAPPPPPPPLPGIKVCGFLLLSVVLLD